MSVDRARGALLGGAAGDALGAPYEFGPPLGPDVEVGMVGGGSLGRARGEWTDDTAMAVVIAQEAVSGSLLDADVQDRIVTRWAEWASTAQDVGNQTRAVLGSVPAGSGAGRAAVTGAAASALAASRALHERTGHTGGNGALMRTAPVALACLDDEDALVRAATEIGALTHWDPESGEACVLWCLAIRHAVLTGELDVRVGLPRLDAARREVWARRIEVAETSRPADFERNGWVVEALQAAWSAIAGTPVPPGDPGGRLAAALDNAVRGGRDTDTVAAIAGGLLGAAYGESAIPAEWLVLLHGWPGLHAADLRALADAITAR